MDIPLAVLAENANVAQEGNLNIFGIFSEIRSPAYPATHPSCVLVVQFRARRSEIGQPVKLTIRLMDEDSVLTELEGEFPVPDAQGPGDIVINNIFKLVMMQFPRAGSYAFHVLLNGSERASVPLQMIKLDSPQGA